MRFLFVILLALWGGGLASAGSLVEGGTASVTAVVDGDTVLLDTVIEGSNEVRLVGIQAPKLPLGRKDFKQWPLAEKSKAMLEGLVLGRTVTVKFGGRRMDRHGRLLGHLFVGEKWVQGTMLTGGMARVYSFADNRARIADMLTLERQARVGGQGIWGNPWYGIRKPEDLEKFIGTFQLVEGIVIDAATVRDRTYLNFTDDWREDFTITLDKRALALFSDDGIDPLSYKGKSIRVRGWLKKRNGPMIEVTHPNQIEVLGVESLN
ncbi:MAG: thermonuclease family protein [Rhodospirillales bacterium]|nr:thermonuclease family protein [Rhodospirillales bacterium]